jgi:hypothetical protein
VNLFSAIFAAIQSLVLLEVRLIIFALFHNTADKMPIKCPFPDVEIPEVDILSYIFPPNEKPSTNPMWIDSQDQSISLSPAQMLQWVKRLAFGLERSGVKRGDVVMTYTPNHVFVPVAYLGIVGAGFAFTGANPIYTLPGET